MQAILPSLALGASASIGALFNFDKVVNCYYEIERNLYRDLRRAQQAQRDIAAFNATFSNGNETRVT